MFVEKTIHSNILWNISSFFTLEPYSPEICFHPKRSLGENQRLGYKRQLDFHQIFSSTALCGRVHFIENRGNTLPVLCCFEWSYVPSVIDAVYGWSSSAPHYCLSVYSVFMCSKVFKMAMANDSMEKLQEEVEEGLWRVDPAVLNDIFNRYLTLIEQGERGMTGFGTPDFWDHVENGRWLHEFSVTKCIYV